MRSHIGTRLQHNDQALDLVTMAGMQQQVNSFSFTLNGFASHFGECRTIYSLKLVYVPDDVR